jgi:hypothetical protein
MGAWDAIGALASRQLGLAAAGVLSVSPRALVSRRAAAHLWGLLEHPPQPIELVVPADRSVRPPAGCTVWRTAGLLRADSARAGGIPATTVPRTLCDLAAVVGDVAALAELVAVAVQKGLVTIAAVHERAERSLAGTPRARGHSGRRDPAPCSRPGRAPDRRARHGVPSRARRRRGQRVRVPLDAAPAAAGRSASVTPPRL